MSLNTLLDGATWYFFRFNVAEYGRIDFFRSLALWLTIVLVLAFIAGVVVSKDKRAKFLRISGIAAICYAAALVILFSALTFADDGIVLQVFLPILVAAIVIILAALVFGFSKSKTARLVAALVALAALVAALVALGVYYATGKPAEDNWLTNDDVETIGLYVSAAALIVVLGALAFLFDKGKKGFDTKSIAYAAVCIAMSFALSYIRIVKMPQGGSVTIAATLPLMLYAYMFGTKKGVFAGIVYGILQAVQDPYILHPAQFLLDYPLASAGIGVAGILAGSKTIKTPAVQFAIGSVVAGVLRFLSSFLSGMFAFGAFAPEGQSPFVYSLVYQATYVPLDVAIATVVGVIILLSKSFVKQIDKVRLIECPPKKEEGKEQA